LSRLGVDKEPEKALLRALAAQAPGVKFFWRTPGARMTPVDDVESLVKKIHGVTYDGALSIEKLGLERIGVGNEPIDFWLMFSDGLVTLGEERMKRALAPVYTVNGDARGNHALLQQIAQGSGGLYLNLQRMKAEEAAGLTMSPRVMVSVTGKEGEVAEIYPKGAVPVVAGRKVMFAGRLLAPEATLTVSSGIAGNLKSEEVKIKAEGATETGLVPRFWAQQKVADLTVAADKNEEELVKVGKEFGIVTPATSLMVLETVEQYLRHHVVPPKSWPEMYAEFQKRVEEEGKQKEREEAEKITRVLAMWQQRVEWWERKYEVPKDFAWKGEKLKDENARTGADRDVIRAANEASTTRRFAEQSIRKLQEQVAAAEPSIQGQSQQGQQNGQRAMVDNQEHLIPYVDLLVYPENWVELTRNRVADQSARGTAIAIKPWSPETPYLKAMAAVPAEKAYEVFLTQRKDYVSSPAFYLDCGNFLLEKGRREEGVRVLTDIVQLRLESAALLRVAAYRLLQAGEYDLAIELFEKVKRLRPDEPQSWRDLAVALSERALARPDARQMSDLRQALELYKHVVMNKWERFEEIEVIALMEANALWAKIQRRMSETSWLMPNPLDPRLVKNLDCDVRVVMTWDADNTDIDLHVIEPSGEEAYYGHNRTTIGGLVSRDFTQGYGPEEYCVRHAMPGKYKIKANYFGSQQQTVQGPVTVQATVITNFGRADEKRESLTLRLTDRKEDQVIGEVTVGK
jgi:tetratricopeptide (TPR) repeat protein